MGLEQREEERRTPHKERWPVLVLPSGLSWRGAMNWCDTKYRMDPHLWTPGNRRTELGVGLRSRLVCL